MAHRVEARQARSIPTHFIEGGLVLRLRRPYSWTSVLSHAIGGRMDELVQTLGCAVTCSLVRTHAEFARERWCERSRTNEHPQPQEDH